MGKNENQRKEAEVRVMLNLSKTKQAKKSFKWAPWQS